jgi:hypothetical protein
MRWIVPTPRRAAALVLGALVLGALALLAASAVPFG